MKQQYDRMSQRELDLALQDKEQKRQYHAYLDWQSREKHRLKQLEDDGKKKELSQLGNNLVEMQGLVKLRQDESKGLKSVMAHQWMSDIARNKQLRGQQRQAEIEADLKRIDQEKQLMGQETDRDKAKKNQWLKEQEQMIQFKEYMKDREKEKALKDHEAYLKAQEERERQKDQQNHKWNQYYRQFDAKLSDKMHDHEQKYLLPVKHKEQLEQSKLLKQLDEAEKAKWDRETQDQQHKRDMAKLIYDGNLERLGLKGLQQEKTKEQDKQFLDQKMREVEAARQREMQEQESSKCQKDMYRETLI